MPSRTPGILIFFTALLVNLSGIFCFAEEAQPVPPVRYHFGDDAQWANANFDDSTWPVALDGKWPLPNFYSDGFVWVRERVPVTSAAPGTLAVRITGRNSFLIADELYVNGVFVGRQGSLPPNAESVVFEREVVFNLPPGTAPEGANAVVAFRAWYSPGMRPASGKGYATFTIGDSRILHLAQHAEHSDTLIEAGLNLAFNGIVLVLGAGLLIFWRSAGGRDLLVCSWMLIGAALMPLWDESVRLGFIPASLWVYAVTFVVLQALSMAATVELVWTVHGLRAASLKRFYHASWVIGNAAFLVLNLAVKPAPLVLWSQLVMMPALLVFDSIQLAVNLWALIARRSNRLIAVALAAIPIADILQNYGRLRSLSIGPFRETYFGISLFLCELALFIMLGQRAWKAWRTRDELRVEFDAAREVQQNSIAQAADVPGFTIESAYLPARQVGGDFFRILPESNGGVIVVLGDVSGKGLKAAMSVSAIMGALQVCPSQNPAEILAFLNRVLSGRVGGFVTCCVARIETDGKMTLANAGHPAPYRNGEEMAVEPGLPLGILMDVAYGEMRYQVSPGDRLTFVSDGVVEATNAKGELYGFERTRTISTRPASAIADAATTFGQEDDITVLSITVKGAAKSVPAPPQELSTVTER
jgi:phosphoserine phosphatase RsbU/P